MHHKGNPPSGGVPGFRRPGLTGAADAGTDGIGTGTRSTPARPGGSLGSWNSRGGPRGRRRSRWGGPIGSGSAWGTAEAAWGLQGDGPEAASLPWVAGTSRPAEAGDVLEVSWGGRTRRSGCRRTRQVGACVGSHRSEAESLSGCPTADPPLWGQAVGPAGSYRALASPGPSGVGLLCAENCFCQSLAFHEGGVTRWFVPDSNLGLLPSVTS